MKTQILTDDGLSIYDQEIKNYIKNQGIGVTLEDVQNMISELDTNTTYTLTKNENNEIVLTGSDGSVMKINDSNTTNSTNSSSKLFLIGATSQAANPQTYSHDTVYVGTDECLYSNNTRVISEVTQSTEPTTQIVGDIWNQEYIGDDLVVDCPPPIG